MRNQLCPCGSGIKFKKCCLKRIRKSDSLNIKMCNLKSSIVNFGLSAEFSDCVENYKKKWHFHEHEYLFENIGAPIIFMECLYFDFTCPDCNKNILKSFLLENAETISDSELKFFNILQTSALSIYEVIDINENLGIKVKNVFNGKEAFIYNQEFPDEVVLWDLLICRKVFIDGIHYISGAALILEQELLNDIKNFFETSLAKWKNHAHHRNWKKFFKQNGHLVSTFLLDLHNKEEERRKNIHIVTKEGDPLIFMKCFYEIHDKNRILEILRKQDQLIEVATEDNEQPHEIHFNWHHPPPEDKLNVLSSTDLYHESQIIDNTSNELISITGEIFLDSHELRLECLSKERLVRGKIFLENLLNDLITHITDEFTELDDFLFKADDAFHDDSAQCDTAFLDMQEKYILQKYLESHYSNWITMPLPIFGGKSPKEMSTTENGRMQLNQLLKIIENSEERKRKKNLVAYDVSKLRKALNLL